MTDAEIDALPAGPEMDRAVAEAMGYEIGERKEAKCIYRIDKPTSNGVRHWHPFPVSSNSGVALAALERWVDQENGEYAIYRMDQKQYTVRLYPDFGGPHYNKRLIGMADTFAVAICRALLKAEAGRKGKE